MNYERKSAVLIKALKWLSRDKIKAIENREEHLHKVVRIYNTIDHLAKVDRRSRKRRNTMARQNEIPAKRQNWMKLHKKRCWLINRKWMKCLTPPPNLYLWMV